MSNIDPNFQFTATADTKHDRIIQYAELIEACEDHGIEVIECTELFFAMMELSEQAEYMGSLQPQYFVDRWVLIPCEPEEINKTYDHETFIKKFNKLT